MTWRFRKKCLETFQTECVVYVTFFVCLLYIPIETNLVKYKAIVLNISITIHFFDIAHGTKNVSI